ncbi:MAG TPA: DUF1254 domain-containing protein [Amaricoccus sp.]|nr:DUF1254 domain-containing protein [Amaricoccus sp.]HMQ92852.1 DUF1254 domain-containing protein [Amaricoccus sp.]HMR37044.1 DUF1254 domain-containing protein [Paracoccus sp. (in: a-proteobacteria)]HMU01199.1 DUF1254 domain-containing protein [Amaricoccus sp.]
MRPKTPLLSALLASTLLGVSPVAAQQPSAPPSFADLTMPSAEVKPQEAYVRAVARTAYLWGWPMVNMLNRRTSITQAPQPRLLGGILPVAPQGQLAMLHDYVNPDQRAVACPNQDVVYGLGFFDLDSQPVVIQVPDFGDRFWVYATYDQRTDQFGQLGKAYGTEPGFYLLAGPTWNGEVPKGITGVVRASTSLANVIPRIFMNDTDEDRAAIQPLVNQVVAYPLSEFDGTMKEMDWSGLSDIPSSDEGGGSETRWVVPEKFFDTFPQVLAMVPPLPGEEALYAQFRWLMDVAADDPDLKAAIVDEAVKAEAEVIAPFLEWRYNGKPAGNGWNRSVNNAQFGVDYYNRAATARSNIFENRPNETQYFYTDDDAAGAALDGSKTYAITFAAGEEPPVNGFWSLTLYNEEHFFNPNDLGRYSLGTKNTTLQRNADGSLTLYAGATSPGADKESNWLPAPDGPFSLYIRAYWGKEAILDGTWQPPKIEVVQ